MKVSQPMLRAAAAVAACWAWGPQGAPAQDVATLWNEQVLNAIRVDTPRPTVHARNLFHLSAAAYDAWATFDNTAVG